MGRGSGLARNLTISNKILESTEKISQDRLKKFRNRSSFEIFTSILKGGVTPV